MNWPWKRKDEPSAEARAAIRYAEQSLCQADKDLKRAERQLNRSKAVTGRLREHNVANHYDDWLAEQFLKYYNKT